jgi:hypothetical protein
VWLVMLVMGDGAAASGISSSVDAERRGGKRFGGVERRASHTTGRHGRAGGGAVGDDVCHRGR